MKAGFERIVKRLSRPWNINNYADCVQERGLGDRAGARGTYRRQAASAMACERRTYVSYYSCTQTARNMKAQTTEGFPGTLDRPTRSQSRRRPANRATISKEQGAPSRVAPDAPQQPTARGARLSRLRSTRVGFASRWKASVQSNFADVGKPRLRPDRRRRGRRMTVFSRAPSPSIPRCRRCSLRGRGALNEGLRACDATRTPTSWRRTCAPRSRADRREVREAGREAAPSATPRRR